MHDCLHVQIIQACTIYIVHMLRQNVLLLTVSIFQLHQGSSDH